MEQTLLNINKILSYIVLGCACINMHLYQSGNHTLKKHSPRRSSYSFPLNKKIKSLNKPANSNLAKFLIKDKNNNSITSPNAIKSIGSSKRKPVYVINSPSYVEQQKRIQELKQIKKDNSTYTFNSYLYNAKLGNLQSMVHLGDCYYKGQGVNKDQSLALLWYKKAANLGNITAMMKLGDILIYENSTEAVLWYRKAAQSGHNPAKKILNTINEDW
jgi:hypothetical protein